MTQMELADKLCISYQAVSNWERGVSMPDISKPPELAVLFDTTIDDILCEHSSLVENAAAYTLAEYLEEHPFIADELCEAAPILKPSQVTATFAKVKEQSEGANGVPDINKISNLLPVLDEDTIGELAEKLVSAKQYIDLPKLAPFMYEDTVDEIAHKMESDGVSIAPLVPFMYEDTIDEIAVKRAKNGQSVEDILPFVSKDILINIALMRLSDQ